MQLLKTMFEYQKNKIIQKLITQIEKPKKKKKSKALVDPVDVEIESKKLSDKAEMHLEWKQQIMSLAAHKIFSTLMEYLDMCRHIYRQDFDELRSRWSLECTTEAERVVMGELEHNRLERAGPITVPADCLMIYAFQQIDQPPDLNIRRSVWKKIKTFIESTNSQFKAVGKEKMEKIEEFKAQSFASNRRYRTEFKYIPCDSVM